MQCIKEDGLEQFSQYIVDNQEKGLVYHRTGIMGITTLKQKMQF